MIVADDLGCVRSVLFAPANHPRRVAGALRSPADIVVLDLEDAVPALEKGAARNIVRAALADSKETTHPRVMLRVNSGNVDATRADLELLRGISVRGIVLPKAEDERDILMLASELQDCEQHLARPSGSLEILPIIESARGLERCQSIAATSSRVQRLMFGGADYTLDLNLEWSREEHELTYARSIMSHASRLAGIEPPIDTPVLEFRDLERFAQSAGNARRLGFQGKICLHPAQLTVCHAVFSPSEQQVEQARTIVAAFAAAQARGEGAIQVGSFFVDLPVALRAQRLLKTAEDDGGRPRSDR